jgi:hypothetical protein
VPAPLRAVPRPPVVMPAPAPASLALPAAQASAPGPADPHAATGPAPTAPVTLLQPGRTVLAPAPTLPTLAVKPLPPAGMPAGTAPPALGEALFQEAGPLSAPSGGFSYRPRLVVSRFGAGGPPAGPEKLEPPGSQSSAVATAISAPAAPPA